MTDLSTRDRQIIEWILTNFHMVPECLHREHQWMALAVDADRKRVAEAIANGTLSGETVAWDAMSFPRGEVDQHLRNLLTIRTLVAQMLESLEGFGRDDLPERRLS